MTFVPGTAYLALERECIAWHMQARRARRGMLLASAVAGALGLTVAGMAWRIFG
jgi:hypothetical protein